MKKSLVHSLTPPRTENKSARRMKQATLVVALLLPGITAWAQRFPDASGLLANVRLRQSQHGAILLWVDKDNGALMRMEGYDSAGKMIKRFEVVSAQKIENRWYLKQMRVERIDPQSGRVTARTYLEITK